MSRTAESRVKLQFRDSDTKVTVLRMGTQVTVGVRESFAEARSITRKLGSAAEAERVCETLRSGFNIGSDVDSRVNAAVLYAQAATRAGRRR